MSAHQLVPLLLNLSMSLVVLSLGMRASWDDIWYLPRHPGLMIRSVVSMNFVMPFVAAMGAVLFNLPPVTELALVAIALSPVPPILPNSQSKAGGSAAYIVSLLTWTSILSIVVVPLGMLILEAAFKRGLTVHINDIVPIVVVSVLLPLGLGIVAHAVVPALARQYSGLVGKIGLVLLAVTAIPVVIVAWPTLSAPATPGTLVALVAFSIIGICVGHLLGRPYPDDSSVLALATGARHPGVAIAIASIAFPDIEGAAAVVLWHLIIGSLVALPYIRARQRAHALGPMLRS